MHHFFESRLAAALLALTGTVGAVIPLFQPDRPEASQIIDPIWPTEIDSQPVHELELGTDEARFARGFPGRIKRMTDGQRIYILRWVTQPTRKLHPAADCFRGLGYAIRPQAPIRDGADREWGCFAATSGEVSLRIRERITDASGRSWTDVQAWYWAAALGRSVGPWWATTVVE